MRLNSVLAWQRRVPEAGLIERLARWRVPLGFVFGLVVLILARPTPTSVTVGGLVALVGESLRLWASGHLNKAREVTTSGPYRWLGHPLYVGSSIMGMGLAIAASRAIVAVVIAGYLAATLTAAVRSEQAFLRRTFGDGYARYRSGVTDAVSRFQISRLLVNREHRTVVGLVAAFLVLLARALSGV